MTVVLCLALAAAVAAGAAWAVLSDDGRQVARYILIAVMRWFD